MRSRSPQGKQEAFVICLRRCRLRRGLTRGRGRQAKCCHVPLQKRPAWCEPGSPLATVKAGLLKAVGDNKAGFRGDRTAHAQRRLVKKTKQTLTGPVDERTINPNALQLEGLVCAAVAIIAAYRIPWETIPSATWRKHFLGMGRSPGFDRAAWKRAAVDRCRAFKIDVKNADAAEAVGIAIAGEACQRFKIMRQGVAA